MRQLCSAIFILLLLSSCRDKVICPTFQSTYILDDSVRSTYFSYLWYLNDEDRKSYLKASAPVPPLDSLGAPVASTDESAGIDYFAYTSSYKVPPRPSKRTKFGIAKRSPVIPNLVRNLQLKTSPMENVLTPPEVENEVPGEVPQDSSGLAPLDSTSAIAAQDTLNVQQPDSTAIAKEVKKKRAPWEPFRYGFNPLDSMQPDQEYYFKKYGWLLQNAPPKEDKDQEGEATSDSTRVKRKGFFGLFKKKDKGTEEPEENTLKEKKVKEKKPKKDKSKKELPSTDEATKPEEKADEGF